MSAPKKFPIFWAKACKISKNSRNVRQIPKYFQRNSDQCQQNC